jgi:hypothetical protein
MPAATAAAFATFFAAPLTVERLIEPERFLLFAVVFCLVPRFIALALELFDAFFALRFAAFAMVPPSAPSFGPKPAISASFCSYLNADGQARSLAKKLSVAMHRLCASVIAQLFLPAIWS